MYIEVTNKLFKFKDSTKMIEKDKKILYELRDYLIDNVGELRTKGVSSWKLEFDPEKYFSKYTELERRVIIESMLPKDGIGRCIESYEMLKIIYGESYVRDNINSFERNGEK